MSPWLWLAVAALVAGVTAALIVVFRRRRRIREWQERATATARAAAYLNDTYVPGLLGLSVTQQLQQCWREDSARFSEIDAQLSGLVADAPDEERRTTVEAVRGALARLRQSAGHVVELAAIGAPADVQRRAATDVHEARTAATHALSTLTAAES